MINAYGPLFATSSGGTPTAAQPIVNAAIFVPKRTMLLSSASRHRVFPMFQD
jgi:hypothetical protein